MKILLLSILIFFSGSLECAGSSFEYLEQKRV